MKITINDEEIVPEIYSLHLSELASLIYFLNDYIDRLKEAECTKDEIKEVEVKREQKLSLNLNFLFNQF